MADQEKDSSILKIIDVEEPEAQNDTDETEEIPSGLSRLKSHLPLIYGIIAVVVVILVALGIYFINNAQNPINRFMKATSKTFGTSFDFEVEMQEDGQAVMSYTGSVTPDRGERTIQALYQADYQTYSYTGALSVDGEVSKKGVLYKDKWTVRDVDLLAQDYFDFDKSFSEGEFDSSAFLRFAGLNSKYTPSEFDKMMDVLKKRMSGDSAVAEITTKKDDNGTVYHYDIDLGEMLSLLKDDGAAVFYSASDYDKFSETFKQNEEVIKNAECTMEYTIDTQGYLSSFEIKVISRGKEFGVVCKMSNFSQAKVELPKAFADAEPEKAGE